MTLRQSATELVIHTLGLGLHEITREICGWVSA